jgi:hypothetical protein
MRVVLLAAALAATGSVAANADDLADLKAQLEIATKSIQALQKRVQSLEAEKVRASPDMPARQARAAAKPVEKAPPLPLIPEGAPVVAPNQKPEIRVPGVQNARLELYGAAQLDAIYDAKRVDPNWEGTLRPSKIPVNCPPVGFDPGCGKPGVTNFSIRQSTFGVKGFLPTEAGEINTQFEIDLWGGADVGRITARLKQAWGSVGPFLAGQTYSLFMDPDAFPNIVDFWGPTGTNWLYDPQVRWTPYDRNGVKFAVALEVPGASVDLGKVADLIPALANVREKIKYPDVTAQLRAEGTWGHAQLAGVARLISFDNPTGIGGEPANTLFGWGLSASGHVNTIGKDALRGQIIYGRGIAAYSNDCCFDLGPNANLRAQTLPLLNWMVYYDHYWDEKWSTSFGFSQNQQDNSAGQLLTEQHQGSYASVNLLYKPMQNILVGVEGLWGERVNKDGARGADQRVQFTSRFMY